MLSPISEALPPGKLLRLRLEAALGRPFDDTGLCLGDLGPERRIEPAHTIISCDDDATDAYLLASGFAAEVRVLADGRRQLFTLRLPGDVLQGDSDEEIVALTAVDVVDVRAVVRRLGERAASSERLRRAWVAAAKIEQGWLRDNVVRLGRLSAFERMAHLFAETHDRLQRVGLATRSGFHFPLRQEMLSDLLGLSVVHVSRTVQQLKAEGVLHFRNGYVSIADNDRLREIAHYTSRFPRARLAEPPQTSLRRATEASARRPTEARSAAVDAVK